MKPDDFIIRANSHLAMLSVKRETARLLEEEEAIELLQEKRDLKGVIKKLEEQLKVARIRIRELEMDIDILENTRGYGV